MDVKQLPAIHEARLLNEMADAVNLDTEAGPDLYAERDVEHNFVCVGVAQGETAYHCLAVVPVAESVCCCFVQTQKCCGRAAEVVAFQFCPQAADDDAVRLMTLCAEHQAYFVDNDSPCPRCGVLMPWLSHA